MGLSFDLVIRNGKIVDGAGNPWYKGDAVIAEGKDVTYDMKPHRDDPTAVGTSQMADAIIEKIGKP